MTAEERARYIAKLPYSPVIPEDKHLFDALVQVVTREIRAAEAAAYRRGQAKMRERADEITHRVHFGALGHRCDCVQACALIRALPIEEMEESQQISG